MELLLRILNWIKKIMNPQSTDRITRDTNIKIDRLIDFQSTDFYPEEFDPNIGYMNEITINYLPTSSYFSSNCFFVATYSGTKRIYKNNFDSLVAPFKSGYFYNYTNGTKMRFGGSFTDYDSPTAKIAYFVIRSINSTL
tara:strand:+ start:294 stop:710 length:417 start_codon:yes stop_codon:yes gene_type:complete